MSRWIILRASGGKTLAVAASLAAAGFDVWTPARTLRRKVSAKTIQGWRLIEVDVPILPTFIFARAAQLEALAVAATQQVSPHPAFSVFRHAGRVPLIGDREVQGLRDEEAREADLIRAIHDAETRAEAEAIRRAAMKSASARRRAEQAAQRAERASLRSQRTTLTPGAAVQVAGAAPLVGVTGKPGYRPPAGRKTLAGILGSIVAAATLFTTVPLEESGRKVVATVQSDGTATVRHVSGPQYLRSYLDAVGVATACDGITKGVKLGQRYTEAQCTIMLEAELIEHAEGVIACVPGLYGRDHQAPAAVSLAYNIGVGGFCTSTVARMFRAGRWREGCDAFPMWVKGTIGGKRVVLPGLVKRRARERAMCLTGLPA